MVPTKYQKNDTTFKNDKLEKLFEKINFSVKRNRCKMVPDIKHFIA